MIRGVERALPITFVLLAITSLPARAQFFDNAYYPYGYGNFGWGGWGAGTVQGDMARGLGQFAAGAGALNQQSALANAVNGDTVARWNDYMYQSQHEADQQQYKRMSARQRRDKKSAEMIYKRLRDNPTEEDIANGDALNVALHELSDPKLHRTALRLAKEPLSGDLIDDIPFITATDAISLSLNQLSARDEAWPAALSGEAFAPERQAYQKAIAKALEEDKNGDISARTLEELRKATAQLRTKLAMAPPEDQEQAAEAENYVKTLIGLTRMLQKPKVEKIIAELEKFKKTSLANLLGFMHTFNLRFGRATTPRQREVYAELYPILAELREQVRKEAAVNAKPAPKPKASAAAAASSPKAKPTDFFRGMHLDHLEGKPAGQAAPAKP